MMVIWKTVRRIAPTATDAGPLYFGKDSVTLNLMSNHVGVKKYYNTKTAYIPT